MQNSQQGLIPVGNDVYIPKNLEQALDAFYKRVNPDKETNIPAILKKYAGKEYVLFNKLLKIYGEDPWPRSQPSVTQSEASQNPAEIEVSKEAASLSTRDELIDSVTKEVAGLKNKIEGSERLIAQKEEEIKHYHHQLDENCQRLEELELTLDAERKETAKKMESFQSQVEELLSSRAVIQSSYDKQSLEVEKLHSALESKEERISQLQEELASQASKVSEAEAAASRGEVEALKEQLRAATEALEKEKAAVGVKEKAVSASVAREKELMAELATLRETLSAAPEGEGENEEMKKEKEAMKSESEKIKKENEEMKKENEKMKKENEDMKSESEKMKKENEDMKKEKEAMKKESEKMKKENEEMKKENEAMKKEQEDINKKLLAKKKMYDDLAAAEIQNLKKTMSEVEAERDALDKSNSELTLEVQRLQHELDKSKEKATEKAEDLAIGEHLKEVMRRNEALEVQIISQQKEAEQLRAQQAADMEAKEQAIKELNDQNATLNETVTKLKAEASSREASAKTQEDELEKRRLALEEAEKEKVQLRADMEEKEKILAETTEEHIMLQGVMKSVQEELKQFKEEQAVLQAKYEEVLKSNQDLCRENEALKRDMKETKEQLADDLIKRLQTENEEKRVTIPTVSTQVDAAAFTLKSFLEFSESILSEGVLSTVDLEKQIDEASLKQIQGLLLDRVVTILGLISNGIMKEEWKKDDDFSSCHNCHSQFSFFSRKHHCRRCGNAFCSKCSNKFVTFPGMEQPERVCDDCFIVFDRLRGYLVNTPN